MKAQKTLAALLSAMILSTVIAGCGENPTESSKPTESGSTPSVSSSSTVEDEAEEPAEIHITTCLYYGDVSDFPELKENWPKEMEEKYGYKVVVNALARNEYIQKVNTLVASQSIDGILRLFTPADIWSYRDQGVIDSIDDYLADNETWQSLPVEMQKQLVADDGLTWGFPSGFGYGMFTRTIRQDWLDNLGLEVPKTVDDLYEVAKAFTFNDPDGNGKDDTYGLTAAGTWNLQDIFQAFGCRLDNTGGGSICYDPVDNCWLDSMLKPEMVECLTYLNKMYSEGILDQELFTNKGSNMRDKVSSGVYGSTFYWVNYSADAYNILKNVNPTASFTEIPYLTGNRTEKINHVTANGTPNAILKSTEDAKGMLNAYIDMVYGSEELNLFTTNGMEGVNYRRDGNKLYTLLDDSGTAIPTPGIGGLLPSVNEKYYKLTDGMSAEEEADAIARLDRANSFYDTTSNPGLWLCEQKNDSIYSSTYLSIGGDISIAFETAVSAAITGSVPVEEAIATYLAEVKGLGAQQVLDECNEFCGYTGKLAY